MDESTPASTSNSRTWVGILVSLASLVGLFLFIDPAAIWAALQTARYEYLLLSVLGYIIFMLLRAFRWRFMLNQVPAYGQIIHIQNIGYMLNYLLPARIGELARAVLVGNLPGVTMAQGISTMVVERVLDLLFMITLLPFTLAEVGSLPEEWQTGVRSVGILGIVALLILIIAANQRVRANRWATLILERLPLLKPEPWVTHLDNLLLGLTSLTKLRDGVILLTLSIVVWMPVLLGYHAGLIAAGISPTPAMTAFVVCAAALSIAAPSSPGQVGVYHAGVTFALVTILGQPEAESASFAFLYHGMNFVMAVLLGIIALRFTQGTIGKVVAMTRQIGSKRV